MSAKEKEIDERIRQVKGAWQTLPDQKVTARWLAQVLVENTLGIDNRDLAQSVRERLGPIINEMLADGNTGREFLMAFYLHNQELIRDGAIVTSNLDVVEDLLNRAKELFQE